MDEDLKDRYGAGVDEIVSEMRAEYLDEVRDLLRQLELSLEEARHGRRDEAALVHEVRKVAVSVRGQAANLGFRLLNTLAHRMEDYLSGVKRLPPRAFDDLAHFTETMLDVTEGRIPHDADPRQLVRGMPVKATFELGDIEVRDVEVMLVMLHGAATHFVERELKECGYRPVVCSSTFESIPLIVRTQPDMVIVSAVMPELSGIDLVGALHAMPATRNIPTALITSLDADDPYLALVPGGVPVIRKGPRFGDDLADALNNLFLL
ncbi:Hpt domain-containing protein [Roseospirillum parvum]|uniref:Hpt domain-containing protein n=1 Tax=Roseospirillum parvum TaxID=83401 RepID=A0A1G7UKY2_9PROT|nr:Hpt domain-containing protein [Roseospirillum parvum]SDG47881.1 Hpt domain-containing protein [Roseospirillum parvum]